MFLEIKYENGNIDNKLSQIIIINELGFLNVEILFSCGRKNKIGLHWKWWWVFHF